MRFSRQKIFLILFLAAFSISTLSAQEEKPPYDKKFSLNFGGGPCLMGIDYGFHLENQFVLEVRKHFSLSLSYGTAQAYEGMDNVKREYSPEPYLAGDDFTRQQSLIYGRLGLEISPINTLHHRAYVGIGPSLNFYNFSGGNIISTADTTIFLLSNRHKIVFTYTFFGGYDFTFADHYLLGVSFYFVNYQAEPLYSIMLRGGYRF
jgi:hypothetical protein